MGTSDASGCVLRSIVRACDSARVVAGVVGSCERPVPCPGRPGEGGAVPWPLWRGRSLRQGAVGADFLRRKSVERAPISVSIARSSPIEATFGRSSPFDRIIEFEPDASIKRR